MNVTYRSELELGAVRSGGQQLVENVEVAFVSLLTDETALLQQVVLNVGGLDFALRVEVDLHPLAEARGIVVAQRLGITERFQHGVGHQDFCLDVVLRASHFGQEGEALLCALRFTGARFARDQDGLVSLVDVQVQVCTAGDVVCVWGCSNQRPLQKNTTTAQCHNTISHLTPCCQSTNNLDKTFQMHQISRKFCNERLARMQHVKLHNKHIQSNSLLMKWKPNTQP